MTIASARRPGTRPQRPGPGPAGSVTVICSLSLAGGPGARPDGSRPLCQSAPAPGRKKRRPPPSLVGPRGRPALRVGSRVRPDGFGLSVARDRDSESPTAGRSRARMARCPDSESAFWEARRGSAARGRAGNLA